MLHAIIYLNAKFTRYTKTNAAVIMLTIIINNHNEAVKIELLQQ